MDVANSPCNTITPITPSIITTPNTRIAEFTDVSQKSDVFLSQITTSPHNKSNDQCDLDIEEDLSDESSVGKSEPTVQKYMSGISIEVDLSKLGKPAVVDFYDECLQKYKFESEFVKDEMYLIAPSKGWVVNNTQDSSESIPTDVDPNKLLFDDSHDVWNICKPHDPLLRCIHSISDRLRIQQLVADPSSYLKRGGDDNHYDIDDPFFDDSDMYTHLDIDKTHVIVNQEIFQNFSPWSEDDSCQESVSTEGLRGVILNPHDFIAITLTLQQEPEKQVESVKNVKKPDNIKLFMNCNGWKKYIKRIPIRLQQPFKELATKWKTMSSNANKIGIKSIKDVMDELLTALFKKALTMPIKTILAPIEHKPLKVNGIDSTKESEAQSDEAKSSPNKSKSLESQSDKIEKKKIREKVEFIDIYDKSVMLPGKLVDSCNKTLRWLVSACKCITNAYSIVDFAIIWLKMTLQHNKEVISAQHQQISGKLAEELPKLELLNSKKFEAFQSALSAINKQTLRRLRKEGMLKKAVEPDDSFIHFSNINKYLRSVGRDFIIYIQMVNLNNGIISSISSSQLSDELSSMLKFSNPYDVLAKLVSNQFNLVYNKQLAIPWQLIYAFVKRFQKIVKIRSLYDGRQKPIIVLKDFSLEKASPGSSIDLKSNKSSYKEGNSSPKNNSKRVKNPIKTDIKNEKRKSEKIENASKRNCRVKPASSMKDLIMGKLCPS